MRADQPFPATWGQTLLLELLPHEPGEAWEEQLPSWTDLVVRNPAEGEMHHGSGGSLPVDTIVIAVDGAVAALADARHLGLENLYADDFEYYQYLRLRAVVDEAAWRRLPWAWLAPGNLLLAWDKFHGIMYVRRPDEDPTMSFGGGWSLLEQEVHGAHFSDGPAPPCAAPPTEADLLAAVRADQLGRVRDLLRHGVAPEATAVVPPGSGLALGFSCARHAGILWESVHHASPAVTEALLVAGAEVDARPEGGLTALLGAIVNRRHEHVPVLLRYGADPRAIHAGKTAIDHAIAASPEVAELLRAALRA